MAFRTLLLLALTIFLTACNISGHGLKGPFLDGSKVTISPLNNQSISDNSRTITTNSQNNNGYYQFNRVNWEGWTEINIEGQFINEFNGLKSDNSILLKAITNKTTPYHHANVNLFSHLATARIQKLASTGSN
ncbi:MAG TPA: hypothetical protein EYH16_01810, partial [Leucothrix mucor]|nr:hypothetical protein [Leucothrix mucor]